MKHLFFLIFACGCFAQNDVNKLNSAGNKDGLWRGFFEESKRIRFEGTFKNGVEEGVFSFFDDTKSHDVVATRAFSENGTVAVNKFFDQKKYLVSEGKTLNRKNEGAWRYYHRESKDLKMTEFYRNGVLQGPQKNYYLGNILASEITFADGKKNGSQKIYAANGTLIEESNFKNNQYDGFCIFRNAMGQIVLQGKFVDGIKKGAWQFFENGKLIKTEKFPKQKKFAKKNDIIKSNK